MGCLLVVLFISIYLTVPYPFHHWLMLDALTENKVIDLKPFDNYEGEYIEPLSDLIYHCFLLKSLKH